MVIGGEARDRQREHRAELTPTEVARKHGLSTGQIYTWRNQLLSVRGSTPLKAPQFASVELTTAMSSNQVSSASSPAPAAHLPRYEVVIDIEDRDCRCCGRGLTPIGEIRTEQLDVVPSQSRVRVTRRPRYACRACDDVVVIAPAPDRPVDGGMPTEALIVHVVVSKFADAQPLYRQVQILSRQGVTLDRSMWIGVE